MEYKNFKVYIILILLTAAVLFLLVYFDGDGTGTVRREVKTEATVDSKQSVGSAAESGSSRTFDSEHMVVYINWDGFAWYYYQMANSGKTSGTPVINELAKQGVLFSDAFTGVPSITNPMQTSLLTGAWPSVTGNCYWYFDKNSKKIVKTGRENKAENLAEAVIRQGFRAVSIHQFMLENNGTSADSKENPYIQFGNNADYTKRFDGAIRYVKGLEKGNLPAFMAVYMDDLDGIGHNGWFTYGVPPVRTEKARLESISKRLGRMDAKLGEFVQAFKAAGIYDKVSFLLTADHGMTPYGIQDGKNGVFGYSKLPDLEKELQSLGLKTEVLTEGRSVGEGTDIVLLTTGLQVQLYFTGSYDAVAYDRITAALKDKEYVGAIMDKVQLQQRGTAEEFADMLISPEPPYCFKNDKRRHKAAGQHDSLDESSQHVFALMWGRGVKENYTYSDGIYVIDFAKTLSSLIGIDYPEDATGRLLDKALK